MVLLDIALICQNLQRATIFEKSLDANEITCSEILKAHQVKKICTEEQQPILEAVKEIPRVKQFIFKYAKANFAVLRVLIRNPYYTLIMQDEEFSYITFIANIGGLLNLSMGLSFISFLEILYCLVNVILRKLFH